MASSKSAAKPLQMILDPTKASALGFVRRPPIDPRTPIQGRPRNPASNAFKEHQKREGVRLQKALNAVTHGKHIFVYHNVRTKQVVYSLTRYLEKNNVLRQLIYHGKKTVPAELRKDMWVPHYSVHFGDVRLGLRAYQLLREFSKQRQLAPPQELITVTEEYLASKRPKDPVEAEEFDKKNKRRIGHPMEKRERARVLMDQKATSVADIAAVLAIQEEEVKNGFLEDDSRRGYLTRKARKRRREALQRQVAQAEENTARIAALEEQLSDGETSVKIAEKEDAYPQEAEQVKILWRDVHDAFYAETWPNRVQHGELQLSRDHVISSERRLDGSSEILTDYKFEEKEQ